MRVHITLAEDDLRRLDERVGSRRRSRFIAAAVRRALDDDERWESLESAIGSIGDSGHAWDDDPARWVISQRSGDAERLG